MQKQPLTSCEVCGSPVSPTNSEVALWMHQFRDKKKNAEHMKNISKKGAEARWKNHKKK